MQSPNISLSEASIILDALDAVRVLLETGKPASVSLPALQKLDDLSARIAMGIPYLTSSDCRIICEGLNLLLNETPMDWPTAELLSKLKSCCP